MHRRHGSKRRGRRRPPLLRPWKSATLRQRPRPLSIWRETATRDTIHWRAACACCLHTEASVAVVAILRFFDRGNQRPFASGRGRYRYGVRPPRETPYIGVQLVHAVGCALRWLKIAWASAIGKSSGLCVTSSVMRFGRRLARMGGMPDPRTRSASAEAPGAVRGQRHEKALGDPCIPFAAAGRALGLRELGRWLFAYAVFLFEAAGEVDQAVRRSACWRSGSGF